MDLIYAPMLKALSDLHDHNNVINLKDSIDPLIVASRNANLVCSKITKATFPLLSTRLMLEFDLVMGYMECSTRLSVLPATRLCSTNSIKAAQHAFLS